MNFHPFVKSGRYPVPLNVQDDAQHQIRVATRIPRPFPGRGIFYSKIDGGQTYA